ncbi:hypothetical protein [Leifsonia sp. 22587]|uniref:hypothetical protein n=1 Tax=Leifsonia sp. 22587 TaxID=3453946 RepID=UPI003F85BE82
MGITLAVRVSRADADVVAATVTHHRAQGVDRVVVIDDSGGDAVRDALSDLMRDGAVQLVADWRPEGDGWILDASAGEFWVATDPAERLADALGSLPRSVSRIDAPVVRLTGPAGRRGSGFARLVFRDGADAAVQRAEGVTVDPTTRTARRPGPDVSTAQTRVEVLRVGSRSLEQRVAAEGDGQLSAALYLAGTPTGEELASGRFTVDRRLEGLPGVADEPLSSEAALERDALRRAVSESLARRSEAADAGQRLKAVEAELAALRSRRVVRSTDRATSLLRALRGRAARTLHSAAEQRAARRVFRGEEARARTMQRLLENPIAPAAVRGAPAIGDLPIVMCLYARPSRLPDILRMLAAQESERPIRLVLWNNDAAHTSYYRSVLGHADLGSLSGVELYESPGNIGGVARFVIARWLWDRGARGPYIMLDDDQQVGADFATTLLAEFVPHSISAWWGFANHGSHWQRSEVQPGGTLDYAGTGGTIADLELVSDPRFFEIPPRFLMMEDQWMTARALALGWTVRKSAVDIRQVMEEETGNQYHGLWDRKDEFYAYLHGADA